MGGSPPETQGIRKEGVKGFCARADLRSRNIRMSSEGARPQGLLSGTAEIVEMFIESGKGTQAGTVCRPWCLIAESGRSSIADLTRSQRGMLGQGSLTLVCTLHVQQARLHPVVLKCRLLFPYISLPPQASAGEKCRDASAHRPGGNSLCPTCSACTCLGHGAECGWRVGV